jgi:hypothetical protein
VGVNFLELLHRKIGRKAYYLCSLYDLFNQSRSQVSEPGRCGAVWPSCTLFTSAWCASSPQIWHEDSQLDVPRRHGCLGQLGHTDQLQFMVQVPPMLMCEVHPSALAWQPAGKLAYENLTLQASKIKNLMLLGAPLYVTHRTAKPAVMATAPRPARSYLISSASSFCQACILCDLSRHAGRRCSSYWKEMTQFTRCSRLIGTVKFRFTLSSTIGRTS